MPAIVAAVAAAAAAVLVAVGVIGGDDSGDAREPLVRGIDVGISPQTWLDARDYDQVQAAGIDVIRIPMNWPHVQSEPGDCEPTPAHGVCNWVELDAQIGNAAEAGARVMPRLSDVPGWVYGRPTRPPLNGEARRGWEDFVDAAVRRYGPGGAFWERDFTNPPFEGEPQPVTEWQIWNEPNGKVYFYPKPNPRKYAHLVGNTADVIRNVDPNAEILLAGMFGTAEVPQPEFLRQMYETPGVEDDFDAIALHPYAKGLRELKLQVRWARREAKRAEDRDVRLWVTELGWASAKGNHPLEKGREGQARLLRKSFELLAKRRHQWNVEGAVWFTWQDRTERGVCRFCRTAGLFDGWDRSKPAYAALKQVTGS